MSCHTAVPYILSRSAVRAVLADEAPSANELRLLDHVTKRVRLWNKIDPYYSDEGSGSPKTWESRGTEAVINALVLVIRDAHAPTLTADARAALDDMWTLQQKSGDRAGAWPWLNFGMEPWEAVDSAYYGAGLAAVAVGTAPDNYRSESAIQGNVALLRGYLSRESASQPLINRAALLWASTTWPGLLDREHEKSVVQDLLNAQRADGGWSLASMSRNLRFGGVRAYVLSWIRKDLTLVEEESDALATAFTTFVLIRADVPRENPQVKKSLSWLVRNQDKSLGLWPAHSLNKRRDPSSNIGRFMSDAATAVAGLALAVPTERGEAFRQAARQP